MRLTKVLCISTLFLLLSSCAQVKQVPYFQDVQDGVKYTPENVAQIHMKPQDKLLIRVKGKDEMLTEWLNLVNSNMSSGTSVKGQFYTIDEDGEIDFPGLGKLKLEGMTRSAIAEYIKQRLDEEGLVKNPVVIVEYAGLTFSVIGEVSSPGNYEITKDYFTLLDALSVAGDLTINGRRQNILVFRQEGEERIPYRVNLCDAADIYSSPVFYLQQNDVIYVEPNKPRARQSTANGNSFATTSFWFTVVSLAITVTTFLINVK